MILRRLTLILLALYALATAYSLTGLPPGLAVSIVCPLIGFAFVVLHAGQREGWAGALRLVGLVYGVTLLFESVGVATGWVYGPYHYTNQLGPKAPGMVPYVIPMMWLVMSYPSFVIAEWLVSSHGSQAGAGRRGRPVAAAALSGLVMTAWDLNLDPLMVARGNWVWETDGAYFGIPLQNFWGWWLTVFVTYALYLLTAAKRDNPSQAGLDRLAIVAYLMTALGTIVSSLLGGAGDLALIGFAAMMPWAIAGWLRLSTG